MAFEPVPGWDARVLIASETTFGTIPALASTQAIECISCDMGPMEVGNVRAKKDKTQGRGATNEFVEGRVDPISFSLETSIKTRAAATTVPKESALYKAGGLVETVGANVVYSMSSAPTVSSLAVTRVLGTGATAYQGERGRGGVVKALTWAGGDQELNLKASGAFAGKYHQGYVASVALATTGTLTFTATGDDIYRIGLGYYLIENEVVEVTAINRTTGVVTITRGALATTAAAHTGNALTPYYPSLTLSGSPISEANSTVSIDGTTTRATKWTVELTTGIDHLPGETGSAYVQGLKAVRYSLKTTVGLVLKREDVSFMGKVLARKNCALVLSQGTGTGAVATFSLPYAEAEPFTVPDTQNELVAVDLTFRHRDSAGNDAFTLTLT